MAKTSTTQPALRFSQVESDRFGLRIFRGVLPTIESEDLLSTLLDQKVDIAFIRLPSDRLRQIAKIEELGLPHLVADTLVYYKVDLTKLQPQPLRNAELEFVEAGPEHHGVLDALVEECFADYTNHYASNLHLDKALWMAGYKEWARTYARMQDDTYRCWLAKRGDEYIAFATCSMSGEECEGVLYAVATAASGGGVYRDLIRFTQQHFKHAGFKTMKVSTQIQNVAVQKVWADEGFRVSESFVTVHVNCFFDRSVRPAVTHDVRPAARGLASELMPFWQHPVDSQAVTVLRPMDAGSTYEATMSIYWVRDGRAESLAQVRDAAGHLVALGYAEGRQA